MCGPELTSSLPLLAPPARVCWCVIMLSDDSAAFDKIKDSLSIQIFKINANVKGIEKLVDKLNGGQPAPSTGRNPREAL